MSTTSITVTNDYPGTAHVTASGDTSVSVNNPTVTPAYIVHADSGSSPSGNARLGIPVAPGESEGLDLKDGESMSVVAPSLGDGQSIVLGVTKGAA